MWQNRNRSSAEVKALALARAGELKRKARALDAMRRSLEQLAACCHGDDRPDCPILEDLGAEPPAGAAVEGAAHKAHMEPK